MQVLIYISFLGARAPLGIAPVKNNKNYKNNKKTKKFQIAQDLFYFILFCTEVYRKNAKSRIFDSTSWKTFLILATPCYCLVEISNLID